MHSLLLINGPNLGRLGARKPEVYGSATLEDIQDNVRRVLNEDLWSLEAYQSNSEGELVNFLEAHRDAAGAIINPGALMMAGWSLHDALEDFPAPWIEVHISNIWSREPFRHQSILSPLSLGVIAGLGVDGYTLAAQFLIEEITKS